MAKQPNECGKQDALPAAAIKEIRAWEISKRVSILRNVKASAALVTLFHKHCSPISVLEMTGRFCALGIDLVSVRKRTKQFLGRTTKLAERLKEDAKEFREVEKFLKLGVEFPVEIEEFSDYILGMYAEELKSTILSRGAGFQSELVDAIRFVKMSTGRPHYRELAELVTAIRGKATSEDDLRKRVVNFEKSSRFFGSRSDRQIEKLVERSLATCEALAQTKPPRAGDPAPLISPPPKGRVRTR